MNTTFEVVNQITSYVGLGERHVYLQPTCVFKKKEKCGQNTDTTSALTSLYMYGVEIMVRIKLLK